jgi:hypothetical protein
LQANRRNNLVVPVHITARAILLLNQFRVQAHGLIRLGVIFRQHAHAGALAEFPQHLLRELLVLGAVERDLPGGVAAAAAGKNCQKIEESLCRKSCYGISLVHAFHLIRGAAPVDRFS